MKYGGGAEKKQKNVFLTFVNFLSLYQLSGAMTHIYLPTQYLCVSNVHSDDMLVAEAMSLRNVGLNAVEMLSQLFGMRHSSTSAQAVLKNGLLAEHGAKYVYTSTNRALCPHPQLCRSYVKRLKKKKKKLWHQLVWCLQLGRMINVMVLGQAAVMACSHECCII